MSSAPAIKDCTKEEIRTALDEVRFPLEIAIYNSNNYFNIGSIIRTCHTFLVKKIHLIENASFYPKATMGTHKWENIEHHETIEEFLEDNKNRNIVALEKRPDVNYLNIKTFQYPNNPILLFGSEDAGIPDSLLAKAGNIVSVEQYGLQNSLNLAVSVGIVIFDWHNKRKNR